MRVLLDPQGEVAVKTSSLLIAWAALVTTGCVSENGQLYPAFLKPEPQAQPAPSAATTPSASPEEQRSTQRDSIIQRAHAVRDAVVNAVRLDGRRETKDPFESTNGTAGHWCAGIAWREHAVSGPLLGDKEAIERGKNGCLDHVEPTIATTDPMATMDGLTVVAALAIAANDLVTPILASEKGPLFTDADAELWGTFNVPIAEKLAARTQEQARAVSVEMARRQAQVQGEQAQIQAAREACAKTPSTCKAKCDSGNDASFCIAWAWRLRDLKPPPLADERAYVKKACDAGNQTACGIVPIIDQDIAAVAAKADELWSDVESPGDEIAKNMWKATFARSLEPMMPRSHQAQNERAIQRLALYTQSVVSEKYCPAKREFVKQLGPTEFAKRAAAHCKDGAPTDTGKDGAEVTLTAQCTTAYATACP